MNREPAQSASAHVGALRNRLVTLLEVIERRELDTFALERLLEASASEVEALRAQLDAGAVLQPDIKPLARDVERLLAIALERCDREKHEIAGLLERTRGARRRMRFYAGEAQNGDSCDVAS